VPLLAGKGYASLTMQYDVAQLVLMGGRPAQVFYFGDYDPDGLTTMSCSGSKLREYAPTADIVFTHAALTPERIDR
jgi:hypothetical protein